MQPRSGAILSLSVSDPSVERSDIMLTSRPRFLHGSLLDRRLRRLLPDDASGQSLLPHLGDTWRRHHDGG